MLKTLLTLCIGEFFQIFKEHIIPNLFKVLQTRERTKYKALLVVFTMPI